MYTHVREVVSGLILSLIFIVVIGVVAIINPWDNGVPWANWLAISVVTMLCVGGTTAFATIANEQSDESYYWGGPLIVLTLWSLVAGFIVGIATTTKDGLDPAYHSLAWTVFAVPYLVMPLASLVQYLAAASAANRDTSRSHLRRVA